MKIKWQWLLYPVTVPLYLVFYLGFLVLVYIPVGLYTELRSRRGRGRLISYISRRKEVRSKAPEGWVKLERYIKGQPPENLQEVVEMEKAGEVKIIDGVIYVREKEKIL